MRIALQVCKTKITHDLAAILPFGTERNAHFPRKDSTIGDDDQKEEKERKDHCRKRESNPHCALIIEELRRTYHFVSFAR